MNYKIKLTWLDIIMFLIVSYLFVFYYFTYKLYQNNLFLNLIGVILLIYISPIFINKLVKIVNLLIGKVINLYKLLSNDHLTNVLLTVGLVLFISGIIFSIPLVAISIFMIIISTQF